MHIWNEPVHSVRNRANPIAEITLHLNLEIVSILNPNDHACQSMITVNQLVMITESID